MGTKLFLTFLFTSLFLSAQTTAIPDPIFEQVLINLGYDSGAINGSVLTNNIKNVRELDVVDFNISDLTGIEDFTSLEVLECFGNNLTYLDVSNNTKLVNLRCSGGFRASEKLTTLILPNTNTLEEFSCSFNALTTLDVSNFTNLRELYCHSNSLTTLDVSKNINLTILSCHNNDLSFLDSKNGNNTKITSFRSNFNPDLSCIQVDNVAYANQNFTDIDGASSFSAACEQPKTYVPDDNFEQALIDLGYDDVLDDYVITANINVITSLNVAESDISDLTGIDAFLALQILYLQNNNLSNLDVSTLLDLNTLFCNNNSLESLIINEDLKILVAGGNNLTSLDLSENTELEDVRVAFNPLTALNIANGNNDNFTFFNATTNPNLTCIQVDDVTFANANFTNIDETSSFSEACEEPKTYVPDDNFEQALIDLNLDDVLDDYVLTGNVNTITDLFINGKEITDLTGIEDFIKLTSLDCSENDLFVLDVTNNKDLLFLSFSQNNIETIDLRENSVLEILYCFENELTNLNVSENVNLSYISAAQNELITLDVSTNTLLQDLYISENNITTLDLSSNDMLFALLCDNNNLSGLNIQNGNNLNLAPFDATFNPNLTCIQVDDVTFANANFTNIDPTSSFSEACEEPKTYVPDDNFEQALIDLNLDDVLDDYVVTGNINTVTILNIQNKEISDLTGIEDFVALEFLGANGNSLTTIDLSNNTNLNNLSIYTNNLEALDVSNNALLWRINCDDNQITSLDLSLNTSLTDISCSVNPLTELNVKNGNNVNVTYFRSESTPDLTCIQVDNVNVFDDTNVGIDGASSFSEDCSASLGINELDELVFSLYPNPSKGNVTITVLGESFLIVYNTSGKEILKRNLNIGENELGDLKISSGMYLFKVISESKSSIKKVIFN